MKTNNQILALFLSVCLAGPVMADEKVPTSPPGGPLTEIDIPKIGPRPRTPGFENEVTGYLQDGVLTISFAKSEGMANIVLNENGIHAIYSGYHSTASPITITMPETSLPAQIFITTQTGNSYEGWIE